MISGYQSVALVHRFAVAENELLLGHGKHLQAFMWTETARVINDIPLSEAHLVISKDACPFQEVIDGFADAAQISVVTFNISMWNDLVLGKLKKAERVAYATSADVTGDTSRVVGYAGVLIG